MSTVDCVFERPGVEGPVMLGLDLQDAGAGGLTTTQPPCSRHTWAWL